MATYTPDQLKDDGVPNEVLSRAKTFTFSNPGQPAYFVLETNRNNQGFYDSGSATNAIGTYDTFVVGSGADNLGLVTSSYIFAVNVPPGSSSFNFTPDVAVAVSSSRLRGTGEFTLTIT